jgi:hypothetical protein
MYGESIVCGSDNKYDLRSLSISQQSCGHGSTGLEDGGKELDYGSNAWLLNIAELPTTPFSRLLGRATVLATTSRASSQYPSSYPNSRPSLVERQKE